jgi:hypothetical protein
MSLQPQPWPEPAEEIAKAVLAMYAGRRAPLPVVVRDELDELFADAEFAAAFADRGTPGWSPGRLALVTVLQMADYAAYRVMPRWGVGRGGCGLRGRAHAA